ncbi:MAG: putative colanic acid biosynthesis acetyltransferase [Phycisphaera sp.]|nr:putative colanic acid biosynthesis acetyltransferase [Phycisphaera sp.]
MTDSKPTSKTTARRPRDRYQLKQPDQTNAYRSPWSRKEQLGIKSFALAWLLLCRWTPGPANAWRLLVLKTFGCRISGRPFVAPTARIRVPWQLEMEDRACIGDGAEIYNLGECILRARCTVAQHGYLCGGSHDLAKRALPLIVAPIDIGQDAFLGAKAFVMPGVTIGEGAVVGAASVVVRDVMAWTIVVGNPANPVGTRKFID